MTCPTVTERGRRYGSNHSQPQSLNSEPFKLWVKRTRPEADLSPPSSAEVNYKWSCQPPIRLVVTALTLNVAISILEGVNVAFKRLDTPAHISSNVNHNNGMVPRSRISLHWCAGCLWKDCVIKRSSLAQGVLLLRRLAERLIYVDEMRK
jgi:hypothetical protein